MLSSPPTYPPNRKDLGLYNLRFETAPVFFFLDDLLYRYLLGVFLERHISKNRERASSNSDVVWQVVDSYIDPSPSSARQGRRAIALRPIVPRAAPVTSAKLPWSSSVAVVIISKGGGHYYYYSLNTAPPLLFIAKSQLADVLYLSKSCGHFM